MRNKAVRTLALALVLGGAGLTAAQQVIPGPSDAKAPPSDASKKGDLPRVVQQKSPVDKSRLEEMLADALKNNPDVRVATARMAEADAELNRVRLTVMQRILALTQEIDALRKTAEDSEQQLAEVEKQYHAGNAPFATVAQARAQLVQAKAKLAADEAELPYLMGKSPQGAATGTASVSEGLTGGSINYGQAITLPVKLELAKVQGTQAERIRKALQTPIKVDFKDMTFDAILKDLSKKVEGLSFRNLFERGENARKLSLQFEEALPVSAILQALADETGCHFFVRDYGIVAVSGNNQPHGAISVQEFLRQ